MSEEMLTIKFDDGSNRFYICAISGCQGSMDRGKLIPQFYSYKHAESAGWRFTSDKKYCSLDHELVAICPACVKRLSGP